MYDENLCGLCSVASDNFYSDEDPDISKYSPVTLLLSSATGILNENTGSV